MAAKKDETTKTKAPAKTKAAPAKEPVTTVQISEAKSRAGITQGEVKAKGLDSHVFGKGIKKDAPASKTED